MAGLELYRFGEFTLEVSERRLSRGGRPVPLAPKAHDVLAVLLRNAGSLVTKADLLAQVWPEAFVEEGILAVHVSALRKALGGSEGARRYIETVARSGYRFHGAVREAPPGRWSVAVLPANPLTAEALPGRDRLTGLTLADALIDRLGRFPQVVVPPIRAVHGYTSAADEPAAIGRVLRVDAVLQSTFARSGARVHVSARLVRSHDGACLWQSESDEAATDILAVADSLAASVAAYLGVRASENTAAQRGPGRQTLPPEVYESFGRGRSHLLSASMFETPAAIEAFRAAVALAPAYAGAHAGLALAHCAEAEFRLRPPDAAFTDARGAALRALAMDDACADAQVALGAVLFLGDWNWMGAERSLRRALALHPNHTEAYLLLGRLLEAQGRLEEGLEMKLRALERDPFSPLVHLQISISYFFQRRYDRSIEWANKALGFDPRHPLAREHLSAAYWKKGDHDRFMAENIKHAETHGATAEALTPLIEAYAAGGRAGIVRLVLERAALHPEGFPDIQLAIFRAEAGDLDAAFRHLDRALERHDPGLVHLAVGPQWDDLRADRARFDERLVRMGLRVQHGSIG